MFITLEGIEGSGKTTLQNALASALREQGHEVLVTREPGGCALGRTLRGVLLDPHSHLSPHAELFLFLADRAQHVAESIKPALDAGGIVLCDRYADSTIVYQGYGRGFDIDTLQKLNDLAIGGLWPDQTLVLDMEPEAALRRALRRNEAQGLTDSEGRFEAESLDFHHRLRTGFQLWANRNPKRITLLDASGTPSDLLQQALQKIGERLGEKTLSTKKDE